MPEIRDLCETKPIGGSARFGVSSRTDFAKRSQFRGRRRLQLGSFVQIRLQDRVNAELRTPRGSARGLARQTKPIPRARESLEPQIGFVCANVSAMDKRGGLW
jgi:hypothetical protein